MLSQLEPLKSTLTEAFKEIPWGAWSLIALYLSLISGIVVGLQYDYQTPFYSATSLDVVVPYGEFFRSLHFYSSQFFFLLCCIHFIAVYDKSAKSSWAEWQKLIAILPTILLLLFTGYILRGDSTGSSAGFIAEGIMHTIPVLGQTLDSLLFSLTDSGLRKVYVHHVIGLDFLLLLLAWKHLRTYRVQVTNYLPVIGLIVLFSLLISAPIEPEKVGVTYISGPWFFLGLQELLRYISPFVAGILVPAALLLALLLSHPRNKEKAKYPVYFIISWLALYSIATTIAWVR